MSNKNFFYEQTLVTEAKTKIYEKYIEGYLAKLIMQFGSCTIIDLFSGSGINGKNEGSPLILLRIINKLLESNQIRSRVEKLYILFNDLDKENIKELEENINKFDIDENIVHIFTKSEEYSSYIDVLVAKQSQKSFVKIPRFVFLDPFTYSLVRMKELKRIMELQVTEILLFIPLFHSYRFASKEYDSDHKTKIFVDEFTTQGTYNYENVSNFMLSVRDKIREDLNLSFVRPILLDSGQSKNSLFLLTKNREGMLLMNKTIFSSADDGFRWVIKENKDELLFSANEYSTFYEAFRQSLIQKIKESQITNEEIVNFTIESGFLPKHAKNIINEFYQNNKIKVFNIDNIELKNKSKWNIAEDISSNVIFRWIN